MKQTLETLFLEQLADIYDAENRLTRALPKMVRAATSEELREGFKHHLNETENHVTRLQQVFASCGKVAKGKKCEAIVGILKEADDISAENKGEPTLDAALICAAQKVEHYEIATYGCLAEWANQLGHADAVELLVQTLEEEKNADSALTRIARGQSNRTATSLTPGDIAGTPPNGGRPTSSY